MALNTDRSGEELQVMTYDDLPLGVAAGSVNVAKFSTIMFDADIVLDGYTLPANTPIGMTKGRTTVNIDVACNMMYMRR
jgi:hypothetical protein